MYYSFAPPLPLQLSTFAAQKRLNSTFNISVNTYPFHIYIYWHHPRELQPGLPGGGDKAINTFEDTLEVSNDITLFVLGNTSMHYFVKESSNPVMKVLLYI